MKANNFVAYSYRTLIDHLFEFQFQTLSFVLRGRSFQTWLLIPAVLGLFFLLLHSHWETHH